MSIGDKNEFQEWLVNVERLLPDNLKASPEALSGFKAGAAAGATWGVEAAAEIADTLGDDITTRDAIRERLLP